MTFSNLTLTLIYGKITSYHKFPQKKVGNFIIPMVQCILNILNIIVQAMNALPGMDRYWKEVLGE